LIKLCDCLKTTNWQLYR